MKHLVYILFTTFFLFFSCAKQKPKGVLSESEAVDLFTELSLVDAYIQSLPLDSGRKVLPILYDNLFQEFGIDSNQFKQNVDYYYGNPILTETLYDNVGKKLMEYEKGYRFEDSVRNVFVQDSIRHISNLQRVHRERLELTTNYTKDTTIYSYKVYGLGMFERNNLHLNAYGIQVPAIVEEPKPVAETTNNGSSDSVATEAVTTPDTIIESVSKKQKQERLKSVRDSIIRKKKAEKSFSKETQTITY